MDLGRGPLQGLLLSGLASCIAETLTMPIDVLKTQTQYTIGKTRTPHALLTHLYQTEGVSGLWRGLSPALLRQSIYGSLRYGLYAPVLTFISEDNGFTEKIVAGAFSGGFAAFIANPTDLIKVRLQVREKKGSIVKIFRNVIKEEGVLGFWKGSSPTFARATVLAAAELSLYGQVRSSLPSQWDGWKSHVMAAALSGFVGTLCCNPFDVVRSRMMGQPIDMNGKGKLYIGVIDCLSKSVKQEGVLSLWKGFWANFARIGPRVLIIFTILQYFQKEKIH